MLEKISRIFNSLSTGIHVPLNPVNIIELSIIGLSILAFYKTYIQRTQYERFVKGILMLFLALLFSKFLTSVLNLQIIGNFIESLVYIFLLGLIVVFQPELRRLLGYLGQPGLLSKNFFEYQPVDDNKDVVEELAETLKYLSKSRIGALIVIQTSNDYENYFEVGTKLNAKLSTELLLTIFHPNTPLHDGAVVVKGDKILFAGVLLPLTEDPKLSWQYGTRHRAAIGMSEVSNSNCIVVSEETGEISFIYAGTLKKCENKDYLKVEIEKIYGANKVISSEKKGFGLNRFLFSNKKKNSDVFNMNND